MRFITEKNISKIIGTRGLIAKALEQTSMGPIFAIRNAPFVDYLDPTLKIQQVVIESITDDRYFQQVPKVDRCMTCHTFIDQAGYEILSYWIYGVLGILLLILGFIKLIKVLNEKEV